MISFGKYSKTITALVGAGIAFAGLVLTSPADTIQGAEWLSLGIGVATALGVYTVANSNEAGVG